MKTPYFSIPANSLFFYNYTYILFNNLDLYNINIFLYKILHMLFISLKGFIKNKQVLNAFMLGDQFFMLGDHRNSMKTCFF